MRGNLPDQAIARTLMMNMAIEPGFSTRKGKVIDGATSIQAALAEMEQLNNAKEQEARKQVGAL